MIIAWTAMKWMKSQFAPWKTATGMDKTSTREKKL